MSTFGERLRQARQRAKLSQESLADRIGVTKGAISQWESGLASGCKIEVLFNLSDVLVVNPRWLAIGTGDFEVSKELPHHLAAAKEIDLIPTEAREPLIKLIHSLAKATEERFWKWAKEAS